MQIRCSPERKIKRGKNARKKEEEKKIGERGK
jgi:hypothetical protein